MTAESRRKFLFATAGAVTAAVIPGVVAAGMKPPRRGDTDFQLNETGWLIFEGVRNGRTRDAIARELAARYNVTLDRALDDVDAYVAMLKDEGLVA